MNRVVVEMTKDKETKNTVRFAAEDEKAVCNTVYINKGVAKDADRVRVIIEEV